MKQIFTFILCLVAFVTPQPSAKLSPNIVIENEAIIATIALPDWAMACEEIPVYSRSSTSSEILYYAPKGTKFRIRSGNNNNNFAMIAVVEWVKTTDLCEVHD